MSRRKTRLKKLVGDAWLRAFGWSVDPTLPPPKAVVVAAPHTSNWVRMPPDADIYTREPTTRSPALEAHAGPRVVDRDH